MDLQLVVFAQATISAKATQTCAPRSPCRHRRKEFWLWTVLRHPHERSRCRTCASGGVANEAPGVTTQFYSWPCAGYKVDRTTVFSRTNIARGNETYRFSATNTLSDIPLLIGEILRRSELRSQRKARPRSPIQKIRAICTRIIRRIRGKSPEVELPSFYSASAREIPPGTYSIPWPTVVQTALKRLSTDSRIWLNVCQYLAFDGDWKPSPLSAGNNIPLGWAHLSVTQKTLALAGAKKFLIEHEPPVAEPGKQTNYSLAGYTAVALLVGQIESDAELASAFRDKWIRAVVQHSPSNGTDSKRALLAICRRLDPRTNSRFASRNYFARGDNWSGSDIGDSRC